MEQNFINQFFLILGIQLPSGMFQYAIRNFYIFAAIGSYLL